MKRGFIFVFLILGFVFIPSVSAKSYGWGFRRNSNHETPDVGSYEDEIEGTNSFYVGNIASKHVYLTFDAGYDNGNMEKLLDVLKQKGVKSTFFLTGDFLTRFRPLVERIDKEGHIVGNHTWGHKDITSLTQEELATELTKVEEAYQRITGKEMVKAFRPPAGSFNKTSLNRIKECGYTTFFWSIAFKDWINNPRGKEYSYQNVIDNLHDGAIILLHTVSNDNVEALPMIIDEIRAQGYTIENLDSIINSGN